MIRSIRLGSYKRQKAKDQLKRVESGGKADVGGIKVGDLVTHIDDRETDNLYHTEALNAIKKASYSLSLVLKRPEENDDPTGNTIQSMGIHPSSDSAPRVSLTIGPKTPTSSRPSSPKEHRRTVVDGAPQHAGQSYMRKFFGSEEDLIEPTRTHNVESERAFDNWDDRILEATRPPQPIDLTKDPSVLNEQRRTHSEGRHSSGSSLHENEGYQVQRSRTLPRNSHGAPRSSDYNNNDASKSLPRKSQEAGAPPNKAPDWYKQMYKEMHNTMETESHLSKLLAHDAKRGAFRKYDGGVSPISPRSPEEQRRAATTDNVPRRLGGGRAVANHPNRKSLPNLHATTTAVNGVPNGSDVMREKKSSFEHNREKRHSINSEWYKAMQKGADIPPTGLRADPSQLPDPPKSEVDGFPYREEDIYPRAQANTSRPVSTVLSTFEKKRQENELNNRVGSSSRPQEEAIQPTRVKLEYNNPPDFLELRRQELNNRNDDHSRRNEDIEKEKEALRRKRAQQRLEEEDRIRKQKERDRIALQEEERQRAEHNKIELAKQEEERAQKAAAFQHIEAERLRQEREIQDKMMNLPEFGRAKYSFHPQGPGELDFRKGDIIYLNQYVDENWLEGEFKGKVGIFPVSYVEFLHPEPAAEPEPEPVPEPIKDTSLYNGHLSNGSTPPKQTFVRDPSPEPAPVQEVVPVKTEPVVHAEPDPVFEEPVTNTESVPVQDEPDFAPPDEPLGIQIVEGLAKARYTFRAETDQELSFKKNDMITLLRQIDENWYEGEIGPNIGIFPANYVHILEEPRAVPVIPPAAATPPPITPPQEKAPSVKEEIVPVVENNVQSSPFDYDELYDGLTKVKDERPASPIIPSPTIPSPEEQAPEPQLNGMDDDLIGKGEPYRVMYNYKPSSMDELSLQKGDVVFVLERCDDGWYVGTCERTKAFGIFPGNYVKPL